MAQGVQTESLMEAVLGEGAGKGQDVSLRKGPRKGGYVRLSND